MNRILVKYNLEAPLIAMSGMLLAYFDSTITFIAALLIAFAFNIIAGFRADEVKFEMWRLVNFKGNKFKDSLAEVVWIVVGTYFIKALMDLMKVGDKSAYAVQILIAIALYYYVRNSFRNLSKAYPRNKWLKVVYYLVSFKFKEIMPDSINKAMEQAEKEVI